MDLFNVCLKAVFLSEHGYAMRAWKLLTFMDRFHVSLSIHNVNMGTFDLHELILYDSGAILSVLFCIYIYNESIETFDLRGQILCVSEGFL